MNSELSNKKKTIKKHLNGHVVKTNGSTLLYECGECANKQSPYIRSHRRHKKSVGDSVDDYEEMEGDHDELSKCLTKQNGSPPGSVYRFYSQFGWYWNYFPKTDYTYLPSSTYYKKEVSPGIPVIPNLSRDPLRKSSRAASFVSSLLGCSVNEEDQNLENYERQTVSERVRETAASAVFSSYRILRTVVTTTVTTTTTFVSSMRETLAPNTNEPLVNRSLLFLITLLLFLPLLLYLIFGGNNGSSVSEAVITRSSGDNYWNSFISGYAHPLWLALVSFAKYIMGIPSYCLLMFSNLSSNHPSPPPNYDKSYDLSFIMSSLDVIKQRMDHLEQQCALQNENREVSDELVRVKVNTLEHNLAELKSNVREAEKSIAETKQTKEIDCSMPGGGLNIDLINSAVDAAVAKYHADQVSEPDFALQSSGGEVVSIRCTLHYSRAGHVTVLGIPLFSKATSPDVILKPGSMPGECYAFEGEQGYFVIKLSSRIKVTAFTMDHAPKEILPRGHMASAPKDFAVLGLKDLYDKNPVDLGKFRFLDNGQSIQRFKAKESNESFDLIELTILSNHGHMLYTCLYRFRVHGIPVKEDEPLYIGGPL